MNRNRISRTIDKNDNSISIFLYLESADSVDIGNQISSLSDDAYMHGFNCGVYTDRIVLEINKSTVD